ncbi:MAG: hypothetical protein C4320_00915 [Armatimonadota bacterium]
MMSRLPFRALAIALLSIVVLALVLLLPRLSRAASTARSEVVRRDLIFWGVSIGADDKGQDAVIREFERRNPDIHVRLTSMGAGGMNPQKLMTSIVGNVAPDLISQDRFTISDWASRGAFRSLDDLLERDRAQKDCPRKEDYYTAPWMEASYGGKQFAIPTGADNRILYWNRTAFKKKANELRAAGLDPDRAPRTWSELLAYNKVLTVKDERGNLKEVGFMPNFGNSWLYLYAFQMNTSFLSADGRTCTMATPETEKALQFIVQGYDDIGGYEKAKTFESGFQSNENDPFILGKVAMKIDGDWIGNGLSRYAPNLDFGVAPPPVPDDRLNRVGIFKDEKEPYVTWVGGFSYAIPRGGKNVEDAWRLIKFSQSLEGQRIYCEAQQKWEQAKGRVYIPNQVASRVNNEYRIANFSPTIPTLKAAVEMHASLAPHGRIRPATFAGQVLWNEHVRALEAASYHRATPMQALKESQANVQRELDAYFNKEQYPVVDMSVPFKLALFGAFAIALGVVVWFSSLKLQKLEKTEAKWAYLFIAPWVFGFVVFTVGPMLASFFFSLTQWDVLNEARWVGGKNYADLFGSDWARASKAFANVAYLAGVGVPLGLFTGLAVALLLNAAARGMRFYRTAFYLPAIVPGIASAALWGWILTPDSAKGLLNSYWSVTISEWFGTSVPGWLASAEWSKPALLLMGVWGAGSGMLLWLAGLKGVSSTLYEAASIDGANPTQQFWSVTFPMLSPIVFFNTVMGFIGAMQEFDREYVLVGGSSGSAGPDDTLLTPVFHLFNNGFTYFRMGPASAIAWIIFAIILMLTWTQFKLAPRWVHYEADK